MKYNLTELEERRNIIIGFSMIFGLIVLRVFILPAAPPDWKSAEHAVWMTSALNWTLGLFMGWAIAWMNMGWVFLPPPGTAAES